MKTIIVTGGIGSGKSMVCRVLNERFGIPVYEADRRAKALYTEVPGMVDDIESSLGCKLRNHAGDFLPQTLAGIIFNDKAALTKVEEILFPVMMQDFHSWAESSAKKVVAFESATVLEKAQFDGFGDIVLLVNAPVSMRLARALERDGVVEQRILDRMAAQPMMNRLSEGYECPRIDHIIVNDSTESDLIEKVADFVEKYGLTKML